MISRADVVVVGGGILGSSVAHFLVKNGSGKVVLLEKNRLCSGSTAYSAANVRQHYSNEIAIRLAVRGTEMFHNAATELGGEVGFVETGYLVIAPHGQEEALKAAVAEQRRLGVPTTLLETDELRALYPDLELNDIGLGALEANAGYADPRRTVAVLIGAAQSRGLEVYEGVELTSIALDGGSISAAVTTSGEIETPVIVNAAGPWAARVGAMAGVPYQLVLSREHEVVIAAPARLTALPIVSDPAHSLFFRPHGRDHLLVGEGYPKETEPCDPDHYNRRADAVVIERMLTRLRERVPEVAAPRVAKDYAGVYSITSDWYPMVGAEETVEGYFCAVGGSGHSFKIGPPLGEALADVIIGREPQIDISSLSRQRFDRQATFASVWGPGNRG